MTLIWCWRGWHAPPPHCHGWPQASCSWLSRFSQIIVGSSLWIADPHWPDFSFQPSPFFEHFLQSPLEKGDSGDDNHIYRKAQLATSWTFGGDLTILILGFLSIIQLALPCVPKIWPPDNTSSCFCFCPTSLPGSRKGSNFFSPAFLSFHIFVYFLHTNAVLFYTFLK